VKQSENHERDKKINLTLVQRKLGSVAKSHQKVIKNMIQKKELSNAEPSGVKHYRKLRLGALHEFQKRRRTRDPSAKEED
jgi:hypothetical protein